MLHFAEFLRHLLLVHLKLFKLDAHSANGLDNRMKATLAVLKLEGYRVVFARGLDIELLRFIAIDLLAKFGRFVRKLLRAFRDFLYVVPDLFDIPARALYLSA